MELSVVIPAFEESKKIGADIEAASVFLEANGLEAEIIVVDDGSRDNTAEAAQKAATSCNAPLKVLRYEAHRGKGYAVWKCLTGVVYAQEPNM
jgi:glycosyltransferase involved in cell wall biosynthesis